MKVLIGQPIYENGIEQIKLLEKHILEIEKDLLRPETRKSAEKISTLLSDDFIEFSSSGNIYNYNKDDVFDNDSNSCEIKWEIKEFKTKELSNDCILATYKLIKHSELRENMKYSLRSSIWKLFNGTWKMIFHQGTLTSEF
jgi:hypothetical protein